MSKWLLPPENAGQVTKQPLVTRVAGAKGDEDARRIVGQHQGSINHFLRSQTQLRAMSGLPIYSGTQELPDIKMVYIYNNGQEYLQLFVAEHRGKEGPAEPPETYWKWALINISIPAAFVDGVVGFVAKAYRRIPAPTEATEKFGGFAYDFGKFDPLSGLTFYSDGMDPFVISYPPHDNPFATVTSDGTQVASLLVDLRRIPKTPVTLELYMRLDASLVEGLAFYRRSYPPTVVDTQDFIGTAPAGDTAAFNALWPGGAQFGFGYFNLGYFVDFNDLTAPTDAIVPASIPIITFHEVYSPAPSMVKVPADHSYYDNITYHSPSNLLQTVTTHSMVRYPDASSADVYMVNLEYNYTITPHYGLFPRDPTSRDYEVRGIGGFEWLDWVQLKHDDDNDFYTWESRGALPRLVETVHLGNGSIGTYDWLQHTDDPENMTHIGTVTIMPVQKVLSFKPA